MQKQQAGRKITKSSWMATRSTRGGTFIYSRDYPGSFIPDHHRATCPNVLHPHLCTSLKTMSRLVRGLHTTCRRLEDITSEYLKISGGGGRSALAKHNRRKAKKVTPESLGFVPFDTSRSRVLPIVGTDDRFVPERKGGARQSTGNSARTSGGQSAKTESQQSSRPPAAASQSETESKVEAVSNEFFEGSDLAAPELRVPLASRFPRTQQRPDTRKCFNCQQPGHLVSHMSSAH